MLCRKRVKGRKIAQNGFQFILRPQCFSVPCVHADQIDSVAISCVCKMAYFRKIGDFEPEDNEHESSLHPTGSTDALNLALKPKVNYDLSSFSPRMGSAFLGPSSTPRDVSHTLDSSQRLEFNHTLQEINRNFKFKLQDCQHKLLEAEQRASSAEFEIRALQSSMPPGDVDVSMESSQISKRLPSPGPGNYLKGIVSRRPASRNGGDESDLRCENLLLVIDDLRARLASSTQHFVHRSQSSAGDESDLWRFQALREQLRWADSVAQEQSRKKEAALSSLRDVTASCKKYLRITPQHLLPQGFKLENSHEDSSDEAHQSIQSMQHLLQAYNSMMSRVLSLEHQNQILEQKWTEASKALDSHAKIQHLNADLNTFQGRVFDILSSNLDEADFPEQPNTFSRAMNERKTVRNLSSDFLKCEPRSLADEQQKCFHMLKHLIDKNAFMRDILEKLAGNMNDQVALVDSILAEFQKLAKCNSSDSQLYSIQRSFQFIHQELVRLDECFHLITKRPSNESSLQSYWKV
jgi:hypothetical protein